MNVDFELSYPISPDLGRIRDLVRRHGQRGGLRGERLEDLVLAANEAVTNVLDHGGGAGRIRARFGAGGFTVEVLDVAGRLTADQLASAQVDATGSHGFGLWVIQRLCDEVTVVQTDVGTLVRLHMRSRPAAAVGRARHVRCGGQETQPAA